MIARLIKLNKNNSLFLFGPRGTGKSTLSNEFLKGKHCLKINLLTDADEDRYARNPDELLKAIKQIKPDWVLIDEIQKAPKLLDLVHLAIEESKCKFFLTGSSARKLKRVSANLLAGRAFTYFLNPFTTFELKEQFDLLSVLQFGSLPKIFELFNDEEKKLFLTSYSKTYLTEEIIIEQAVRNIDLFKDFLSVAAQCNGKVLNYSKIARDIGSTDKTVKEYFQILSDTLIGFKLPSFHRSIRKSQKDAPKFYLFDTGVKRALDRTLSLPLLESTSAYGEAFEHWVILEAVRLNDYLMTDFKFSFLRTEDNEIDLIIERPGKPDLLIEIKSTKKVKREDAKTLNQYLQSWDKPVIGQVWSNDLLSKKEQEVACLHWKTGLQELYNL